MLKYIRILVNVILRSFERTNVTEKRNTAIEHMRKTKTQF